MRDIGRYQVEAEIGRGTSGVVYRARDPELQRTVAVKTYAIPAGLSANQHLEFLSRLRREAQAAAALNHPGIVTVFDAGEDGETGLPFIAMEYVPGRSLAELLEAEGTLPLERVLALADNLAGALDAAHAAGIVHRDIKPANILVRETDGAAKIADFGVARVPSSTLTRSGAPLGSPAYMSPEQVRGKPLDGRSDMFSLASILYELLCGQRPFVGEDVPELLYSVVHETPTPIRQRRPDLPGSLDPFFERALAKDPEARFAGATELARCFRQAASGPPSRADRDSPVSPGRKALAVDAPLLFDGTEPIDRVPGPGRGTALLFAAAGFALMILGAMVFGKEDAHLVLDAKSRVDGELSLLVDGREVYERILNAPESTPEEDSGLLRKISKGLVGPDYENFETSIKVNAGRREVQVVIRPELGEPYRSALVVALEPGETRRLKLVAGRSVGSSLSFHVD